LRQDIEQSGIANKAFINVLHRPLGQAKCENAELQQKVKELEAKLAELEPVEEKAVVEGAEEEQAA
jgi:BMFP domain-containing protein YqiC